MKKIIPVLVTAVFFIIAVVIFYVIQFPFLHTDYRVYHTVKGFYTEETELDAVYIGASNTYAFFQAPLAWHDYGITVYPLSIARLPLQAVKYMIEEARKTQPDALYIINLNLLKRIDESKNYINRASIHPLTDFMRFSRNKIEMVNDLCSIAEIPFSDRLEFYLPIIGYHSNWSKLISRDFYPHLNHLKAAQSYTTFLNKSSDIKSKFHETDSNQPLSDYMIEMLNDLMDYLDEQKLNVLFVYVPQYVPGESTLAQFNESVSTIIERGYPCLNLFHAVDEIGLDLAHDYYDNMHTNIHGSMKYTHYLGKYLIDHYNFEDKRGQSGYEAWDEAYENYKKIIEPYVLDFELVHAQRDLSLPAPVINSLNAADDGFSLSWSAVDGAEGYVIYRKAGNRTWTAIDDVDASVTSLLDNGLKKSTKYTYVVVPYANTGGEKSYGSINITGKSGTISSD